jgi:hypothetical protein
MKKESLTIVKLLYPGRDLNLPALKLRQASPQQSLF